jgi:hypothetical protein
MSTDQPTEPESHDDDHSGRRIRVREKVRFKLSEPGKKVVRWLAIITVVSAVVITATVLWIQHLAEQHSMRRVEPPPPPEPRLIGTWVSDLDAKFEDLRKTRVISQLEEKDMRARATTARVTFTAEVITTEVLPVTTREVYKVVRQDGDEVVIRYWFEATMKEEEFRIRFLGPDRTRLDAPQFNLVEYFRRVP